MSSPIKSLCATVFLAAGLLACSDDEVPLEPAIPSVTLSVLDERIGPFPSDRYTVADPFQKTGRRVQLPLPDCVARPTDCEDVAMLNTLDGFNLQPRLSIPFRTAIDVGSVTNDAIFLLKLPALPRGDDDDQDDRAAWGRRIGINQIVWDPETLTLHAESDELLEQHSRYALVVTGAVRDLAGAPAEVVNAFDALGAATDNRKVSALRDAVQTAQFSGVREGITAFTVFTTQSATAMLEKIRDQIRAGSRERADFALGPDGRRTVFDRDIVAGITWNRQLTSGPTLSPTALSVGLLDLHLDLEGRSRVARMAFGKFRSADFMAHPGEFIPAVPTARGLPVVQGWNDLYFTLYLPSGTAPRRGWPVAILGHGSGGAKDPFVVSLASTFAESGIATIGINAVGHGSGPASTLTVSLTDGATVTFSAGGRGIDQNGDGRIDTQEGIDAGPPRTVQRDRDGLRQTVADLMQLARVIDGGVDADGDGTIDLDRSRIYYVGFSLGGLYGAQLFAVDETVAAAALNVPVALQAIRGNFSPVFRPSRGTWLSQRVPSLINAPGLTAIGGIPVNAPRYHDNLPVRNEPPRVNEVAGAMAIQQAFENMEWASMSGDALAYMPHVRKRPLTGVRARPILIQFAKGDQNVPNPITGMMLRASGLADVTTQYLHDLAFGENGALPKNAHAFMQATGNLAWREIAIGAQRQIATFFASGGSRIVQPQPARFFETPLQSPLTEAFNYIP